MAEASREEELRARISELEAELAQSELQQAELKTSAERFELAMKFASGGHFDWNLETNEIYYSPGWKRLLGYRDDEIENKFSEWERLTDPADVKASWSMLEQLLAQQIGRFELEFKMLHKDGHWVDILSRANAIFDDNGKATRVVGSHTDITQRKKAQVALRESEELFRALFEQGGGYCMILQPQESGIPTILDVNAAACKAHGFTREEMIGRPVADLDDETGKSLVIERTKLIMSGKPLIIETDHVRKDGTVFPVAVCANVVHFTDRPPLILTVEHDITSIREAEANRLALERQMRQAEQMEAVGVLAGGIAHDFNNLLSVITLNASLALSELDEHHESFPLLTDILAGGTQAKALTHQLLTFAKGGAPIKQLTNLNQLIEESANFVMSGKTSRCEFELSEILWPVKVDSGQMSQTINNLVINASQAALDGGIIKVESQNHIVGPSSNLPLPPGKFVLVTISDEGGGIPEEQLPKIFDPYFSTKESGSGLGLATTYSIVSRHGGHITVESRLGVGTTFSIYLPADEESTQEVQSRERKSHKGSGRVLVMDDNETILRVLDKLLRRMGYEVRKTTDGAEAIEEYQAALATRPFDLVILDLTIPGGMGGGQVIPELLKLNPNVKALVSSGYSTNTIMANYQDYGFSGVIPKPYKMEQLSDALNKVFQTSDSSVLESSSGVFSKRPM